MQTNIPKKKKNFYPQKTLVHLKYIIITGGNKAWCFDYE
tara:strand:- start:527 stop:643 length:117 start_codon:yes stop_codon:yes gene_type:complete